MSPDQTSSRGIEIPAGDTRWETDNSGTSGADEPSAASRWRALGPPGAARTSAPPTIAQHGGPAAEIDYFIEERRDVQERCTTGAESADDVKDNIALPAVQRGGRLVHDDKPATAADRL